MQIFHFLLYENTRVFSLPCLMGSSATKSAYRTFLELGNRGIAIADCAEINKILHGIPPDHGNHSLPIDNLVYISLDLGGEHMNRDLGIFFAVF